MELQRLTRAAALCKKNWMWCIFIGSLFIFVLVSMFTNMLELFCMAHGVCPLLFVRGC